MSHRHRDLDDCEDFIEEYSESSCDLENANLKEHYDELEPTLIRQLADDQDQKGLIEEKLENINRNAKKISKDVLFSEDIQNYGSEEENVNFDVLGDEIIPRIHSPSNDEEKLKDFKSKEFVRDLNAFDLNIFASPAASDAQKGNNLLKQIDSYELLLDSRIRLQKALLGVTQLLHKDKISKLDPQRIETLKKTSLEIIEYISELRYILKGALLPKSQSDFERSMEDKDFSNEMDKEIFNIGSNFLDVYKKSNNLSEQIQVQEDRIFDIYSSRINDASDILYSSKFNASEARNPLRHIWDILNNERSIENGSRNFEDTVFYSALLQEYINSKTIGGNNDDVHKTLQLIRKRKKKRQSNHKTSKERTLRFNVIEKLQNFMISKKNRIWHEEQIDKLFTSLVNNNHFAKVEV